MLTDECPDTGSLNVDRDIITGTLCDDFQEKS